MGTSDQDEGGNFDNGAGETRSWQDEIRRQALARLHPPLPRVPRAVRFGALSAVALLHGVGFLYLYTSPQLTDTHADAAVVVRLIDEASRPAPVALPRRARLPDSPSSAAARAPTVPHPEATRAREADAPAPTGQLFNADGTVRLPPPDNPSPTKEQVAAELLQRGHNILHCRQTRFADSYARDETLGDKVSRKYLAWIGMADMHNIEERAARHKAEATEACDG